MPKKSPSRAKATKPAKTSKSGSKTATSLSGELHQLSELRAVFPAVQTATAAQLLAQHDDSSCRSRGTKTVAKDTFSGAMQWARTLASNPNDPGVTVQRELIRWFFDCLTALGTLLAGKTTEGNPADASNLDDAIRAGTKLLARTVRDARDAAGSLAGPNREIDVAIGPGTVGNDVAGHLEQLATVLEKWHGDRSETALPLSTYGITNATVAEIRAAATRINEATAHRPAPKQVDRDTTDINIAEGRLYFVMSNVWARLARAREDNKSSLQLLVNSALIRGLNLNKHRSAGKPTAPAVASPAPAR